MLALAACASPPPPSPPQPAPPRIALIVAERGANGVRLVSVDEHGDRQLELIEPPAELARDTSPAVSPDGKWLVFASSRGRAFDETSLWIAPVGEVQRPRRVTDGTGSTRGAIDAHPTWTPDGQAIVFASTRGGHGYDLWRLELRAGAPGALTQLTDAPGHEVMPSVAADGAIIYAAVAPDAVHQVVESHLEQRAPDGAIRALTHGPSDSSPAVSPDGAVVAFSRVTQRDGQPSNSELWLLTRATGAAVPLVGLAVTDESGPVWSRDGRFVFATSVMRGEGHVLASSVIVIDRRAAAPVARIVEDRVGAIMRLTPAVTGVALDGDALVAAPEYGPELGRILRRLVERELSAAPPQAPPPRR